MDRSHFQAQYSELMHLVNKLYTEISLKENHIVTIENFVEKYLPMRVMAQVSDILNIMFRKDSDEVRKLRRYEHEIKKQFVLELLSDNGLPDLMKVIQEM